MISFIYALVSVFLVSFISLIAVVVLAIGEQRLKNIIFFLVSLAAGGLLGDVFIHLLPEAFEKFGQGLAMPLIIISGIFLFFILEKFLHWRHEHHIDCEHPIQPLGYINLVADGVHNGIDGMLIGVSYLASIPIGIATTIAVILHEIPQEIGDFGVLINSGFSRKKAIWFNFLSALFAVVGTVVALVIGERARDMTAFMIPLTAGGFIYIAGSDLIPELHKERKLSRSLLQLVAMVIGIGVMVVLVILE